MTLDDFKLEYEKKPVIHYPNNVKNNPLVSICITTYQHEKYIGQCIDSILSQSTDFDYEILIGEDDSMDNTRDICINYAKKYPESIRLFLHHRMNNIKINNIPTGRFNLLYNLYLAKGKYIAICEGDDYWLSEDKLSKQIKIIENENAGTIMSDYFFLKGSDLIPSNKMIENNADYSHIKLNELMYNQYHFSHTSTFLFNSSYLSQLFIHPWVCRSWGIDTLLMPIFFENDRVFYLNERMTVYRINHTGISSMKEDGTGSIYKYKAIQFSNLRKLHPLYADLISYEEHIAFLKYFSRTFDIRFYQNIILSIIYLIRIGEFWFIKHESKKLARTLKQKLISILKVK